MKSIHYHLLPLFLAQGARELSAENDSLKEQLEAVQEQNAALERLVGMGPTTQAQR